MDHNNKPHLIQDKKCFGEASKHDTNDSCRFVLILDKNIYSSAKAIIMFRK